MKVNRREFMKIGAAVSMGCMLGLDPLYSPRCIAKTRPSIPDTGLREAIFYEKLQGGIAHCTLCPCSPLLANCGYLEDGEMCVCNVRINRGGKLYVTNYGKPCALKIDPIEKNPIYHMTPGEINLAIATAGCNMECQCCQNWQMSQKRVDEIKSFDMMPDKVIRKARENKCRGISYTFTEPMIYYEYLLDTARLAKSAGLRNCVVTGGYVNREPVRFLSQYIDGFSVSVKGFTDEFYKKHCRGLLSTILATLKTLKEKDSWVEIVVLVIPTLNDSPDQISWFCQWVKDNLGTMVPVHFSRFWPTYRMENLPRTPVQTLEHAFKIAKGKGLNYVYIGNLPGHKNGNTYCHKCNELIIQRIGMKLIKSNIVKGKCGYCGTSIPGVWT